jgi:hypothetical protein
MIKNYRDIIVLLITAGVLILLAVIGVVGGYIGGSKNDR